MQAGSIPDETISGIREILGTDLDRLTIDRAAVGRFFTRMKLKIGASGLCATPLRSIPEVVCCPSSVVAKAFPGNLPGRRARNLLKKTAADTGIRRAVGVATVNALTEMCWERRPLSSIPVRVGVDAYDATEIAAGANVGVGGAFVPFLKSLKRDPATLKRDKMAFFRPTNEAAPVLPDADLVLITGTPLLRKTREDCSHCAVLRPVS
jgi:uncharacterized protein